MLVGKSYNTNFTKKIKPKHMSAMINEITDKNYEQISIRSKAEMILPDDAYSKAVRSRIKREFVAMFTARCCMGEEVRRIIFNRIWKYVITDDDYSRQYPYFLLLMLLGFNNMPDLITRLAKFKQPGYFFTLKSFNKTASPSKYAQATTYTIDAQFLSQMTDLGYLYKINNIYKVIAPIIPDEQFKEFAGAIIDTTQQEQYRSSLKRIICNETQEQTLQAV